METRTYKVFKFDELSPEGKEKAIERYRETNVDYDGWSDDVIDDWKEKLIKLGYNDPKILYSGFGSQGDGACFTAVVDTAKWLKAHKLAKKYRLLYDNAGIISFKIIHNWHHFFSTSTNTEYEIYTEEVGGKKWEAIDAQMAEIEKKILVSREVLGDKIYNDLRESYFYLTEDEQIIETLKANDYDFTEDGKID